MSRPVRICRERRYLPYRDVHDGTTTNRKATHQHMRIDDQKRIAFNVLFAENYGLIVRYTERRVESSAVAEEIAADTFAAAWEKLDPSSPFDLRWLYRTASNKVMNHWTRTKNRRSAENALTRLAEEPAIRSDLLDRIAVRDALSLMRPREREALMLTVWEGLSADEVAEVMDCTIAAVWKLLSRARGNLRRLLATHESRDFEKEASDVSDR